MIIFNKHTYTHRKISSPLHQPACLPPARIALAFALTSTMLSQPYRSTKAWDLLQFVRMASRIAMQEKAMHASSPQAPYVSTASGMHCQPSSEHFVSFCSCFLDSAALAATLAETPASETILGLSGEVTVMSKAAVSLTPQLKSLEYQQA